MSPMFNQVEFIHNPEPEGIPRRAARAIALGIGQRNEAMKAGLATRADVQVQLANALNRRASQFGVLLSAGFGLAVAPMGLIVSSH